MKEVKARCKSVTAWRSIKQQFIAQLLLDRAQQHFLPGGKIAANQLITTFPAARPSFDD